MPLDSRKVAHILSNRAKIEAGRSETVVLVGASGGTVWYQAVAGVLWYDAGAVPAGIANRIAEVTRQTAVRGGIRWLIYGWRGRRRRRGQRRSGQRVPGRASTCWPSSSGFAPTCWRWR